jgi:hypothetical protein
MLKEYIKDRIADKLCEISTHGQSISHIIPDENVLDYIVQTLQQNHQGYYQLYFIQPKYHVNASNDGKLVLSAVILISNIDKDTDKGSHLNFDITNPHVIYLCMSDLRDYKLNELIR